MEKVTDEDCDIALERKIYKKYTERFIEEERKARMKNKKAKRGKNAERWG